MVRKPRILFFTPTAGRTGSEMMLLHLLSRVDLDRFDIGLVSFANGELLNKFPARIRIFVAPSKYTLVQKVFKTLGMNPTLRYLRKVAREFDADVWYVNTTMLPETIILAKEFSTKVITHFHELPLTYSYLTASDFRRVIDYSSLTIGCSLATCKAIADAGGKNVALLYEFIDSSRMDFSLEKSASIRQNLGIPADAFVWICSGMTSERKGFDLIPDIAATLNDTNVHLIWVGQRINDGLVYYTETRIANSTSRTTIHLVGKQAENYFAYLGCGDGFLLTSRQDPFPLVMLEAAHLGKPIASFPSGGVSEFVKEGMGAVTDDISVMQLVDSMKKIMCKQIHTDPLISVARAKRFNVENAYRDWLELINNIIE